MTTTASHDRYSATGREHNGCDRCDGMGCFPLRPGGIDNAADQRLYDAAKDTAPPKLGLWLWLGNKLKGKKPFKMSKWRFVECPDCDRPKKAQGVSPA